MRKSPNLKDVPTTDLFKELMTRNGILHCAAGLYQSYEIRPKYGAKPLTEDNAPLIVIAIRENVFFEERRWLTMLNMKADRRAFPLPLLLVSATLGAVLAHFVLGPLLFG